MTIFFLLFSVRVTKVISLFLEEEKEVIILLPVLTKLIHLGLQGTSTARKEKSLFFFSFFWHAFDHYLGKR